RYHFDPALRQKLLFARNESELGRDLYESLSDAGVISAAESRALAGVADGRLESWTWQLLAEKKRQAAFDQLMTWVNWIQPLGLLAFAAIVLLTAMALIAPLYHLVYALA
ncbi:MAG: hypothetical protein KDA61_01315, partial [Planctomycetales bacterium]|nr:hypothetical protein [Planctomycetales bacterium]